MITTPRSATTESVADGPPDSKGDGGRRLGTAGRRRVGNGIRVLAAMLMLLASSLAAGLAGLIPGFAALAQDPNAPLGAVVAATVAQCSIPVFAALALVALAGRIDGRATLGDFGVRCDRRALPALLLGVAISAAVVVGVGAVLTTAGLLRAGDYGLAGTPLWAVIVIGLARAFLLQGFSEELIFRGYLLNALRGVSPAAAVIISAVAFGSLHLLSGGGQQNLAERFVYLVMPAGFGLLAGSLRLLTGSLWVAVGVHGGFHVGFLIAALTGGGEGPALWAGTGVVYALAGVLVLVVWRRRGRPAVWRAGLDCRG